MIRRFFVLSLIVFLFSGTCSVIAESPLIPDLKGNWTGPSTGYDRVDGYDGPSRWQFSMSITDQRDRVFNGTISYTNRLHPENNGATGISGVIGPDMKSVYLVEYSDGIIIGKIIDADMMEFIYLESGKEASAAIDTFTRVKET